MILLLEFFAKTSCCSCFRKWTIRQSSVCVCVADKEQKTRVTHSLITKILDRSNVPINNEVGDQTKCCYFFKRRTKKKTKAATFERVVL